MAEAVEVVSRLTVKTYFERGNNTSAIEYMYVALYATFLALISD